MSPSRIFVAALALAGLAGCATTSGGLSGESAMYGGNATVTGVVNLPEELASRPNVCEHLSIEAHPAGDAATTVGKTAVRQSRGRCSYTVSKLPAGMQLELDVKAAEAMGCAGLTVTPAAQPLTLQDRETKTRDFSASCATAQAS